MHFSIFSVKNGSHWSLILLSFDTFCLFLVQKIYVVVVVVVAVF